MKLSVIDCGRFKLDGGAMFGVVPKRMWEKLNPPDDHNLCTWALQALLVQTGDRNILIDTGVGDKQGDRFRSHFEPHGANMLDSLAAAGLQADDITDVFLTHLHFDHCGGALTTDPSGKPAPTFPRAVYWSNQRHIDWALHPNPREQASFLAENFAPLIEMGLLKMIEEKPDQEWLPGIRIRFFNGHTEAMMAPVIYTGHQTIVYCADLIPSQWHVSLPYVMAYDIRPLETLREKEMLFAEAFEKEYLLFLEHDPTAQATMIGKDEKGRWQAQSPGTLDELLRR